jgi:hypothetical protein
MVALIAFVVFDPLGDTNAAAAEPSAKRLVGIAGAQSAKPSPRLNTTPALKIPGVLVNNDKNRLSDDAKRLADEVRRQQKVMDDNLKATKEAYDRKKALAAEVLRTINAMHERSAAVTASPKP